MKFTKSLMMPIVLSILGIFTSVSTFILIQVAGKVNSTNTGASPLPIILLVMFVLFLGALSAKKALFARVLSIISISGMTLGMFITAIVCAADFQTYKIGWDSISFLAISISNGKPHNDMAKMAQGKSVVHLLLYQCNFYRLHCYFCGYLDGFIIRWCL